MSRYYHEMRENFRKKWWLCILMERLPKMVRDKVSYDAACLQAKTFQRDWRDIGHVPEQKSDKIYKRFRVAADMVFHHSVGLHGPTQWRETWND